MSLSTVPYPAAGCAIIIRTDLMAALRHSAFGATCKEHHSTSTIDMNTSPTSGAAIRFRCADWHASCPNSCKFITLETVPPRLQMIKTMANMRQELNDGFSRQRPVSFFLSPQLSSASCYFLVVSFNFSRYHGILSSFFMRTFALRPLHNRHFVLATRPTCLKILII